MVIATTPPQDSTPVGPNRRIGSIRFSEPILVERAYATPNLRILNRTQVDGYERNEVAARKFCLCVRYLTGCDGGRSPIHKSIGARVRPAAERLS